MYKELGSSGFKGYSRKQTDKALPLWNSYLMGKIYIKQIHKYICKVIHSKGYFKKKKNQSKD